MTTLSRIVGAVLAALVGVVSGNPMAAVWVADAADDVAAAARRK